MSTRQAVKKSLAGIDFVHVPYRGDARRQKDRGGLARVLLGMSGEGPPLFRNADELCLDERIVRLLGALFALQRLGAVLVGLTRHGMPRHYANGAT
jgi:hypothetical protein